MLTVPLFFFFACLDPDFRGDPSGCTAVGVIVTPELDLICVSFTSVALGFIPLELTRFPFLIGECWRFSISHVSWWRSETIILRSQANKRC